MFGYIYSGPVNPTSKVPIPTATSYQGIQPLGYYAYQFARSIVQYEPEEMLNGAPGLINSIAYYVSSGSVYNAGVNKRDSIFILMRNRSVAPSEAPDFPRTAAMLPTTYSYSGYSQDSIPELILENFTGPNHLQQMITEGYEIVKGPFQVSTAVTGQWMDIELDDAFRYEGGVLDVYMCRFGYSEGYYPDSALTGTGTGQYFYVITDGGISRYG
jgi:hypothetical protein